MSSWIHGQIKAVRNMPRRTLIAIFKGTLAFMVLEILFLSSRVRSGWRYPITLTSATVPVVAGFPGANYGQSTVSVILAMLGIGLGSVFFVILAKLAHAPVAQGILWAIFVYFFAIIKSKSLIFFGFALLGILVTFAGIYTSLTLPVKGFSAVYLEDYLKSYALGGAIVVVINWFVLPISSEKELRRTLVTSLDHIKTFSHLIAKSYSLQITEEEKGVRDGLAQSIRADFGILQQKLGTSALEINWSKYSMEDYMMMINSTHKLQQDLIGMYSTVKSAEQADPTGHDMTLFKSTFLPSTQTSFLVLRKQIGTAIREMAAVLGDGASTAELPEYQDYREAESDSASETTLTAENGRGRPQRTPSSHNPNQLAEALETGGLRRKLDQESGIPPTPRRGRSPNRTAEAQGQRDEEQGGAGAADTLTAAKEQDDKAQARSNGTLSTTSLLSTYRTYKEQQQAILADLLINGEMKAVDDELRIERPRASLATAYDVLDQRRSRAQAELQNRKRGRLQNNAIKQSYTIATSMKGNEKAGSHANEDWATQLGEPQEEESLKGHENLLLLVTSFMFLSGGFVSDLSAMHDHVVGKIGPRTKKRLHFHILEMRKGKKAQSQQAKVIAATTDVKLPNPSTALANGDNIASRTGSAPNDQDSGNNGKDNDLSMHEALALLEGRTPVKPKPRTAATRLVQLEGLVRSDISLGALKTTAAAVTFSVLLLAPSSRAFFVQYGLTGGVLSVVVAMSPSTLFTFFNQIIGTVSGVVYAMITLYIFHDVGGYKWNPYGIACFMLPFTMVMSYLIYTQMKYFPLGLLALNGANLVIFTEVTYENVPTFRDSPALRAGKQLVSMCIALSIAFLFQYLINRSPARKLLRQSTANLMSSIRSYNLLHTAYTSALNSEPETLDGKQPPERVIRWTEAELSKRERQIQADLIALFPLLNFAKLEPEFTGPFRQDLYRKIMVNCQLLLDRMREGRLVLGGARDQAAYQHFNSLPVFATLSPYRRYHTRLVRHRLYLLATALQSKTPLPQDSLATRLIPAGTVQHDALVLTSRVAKEPGGEAIIKSPYFLQVWSHLLCVTSWRIHINAIEEAVGELLGVLEDDDYL